MDGQARGEASEPIVLHEDGQAFAFRQFIEPVADERFPADLHACVERASERRGAQ
jgi:hypothetical protein